MKNLKDTLTNIAGAVFLVGGAIVSIGATGGVALPVWLISGAGVATAISGAVVAYFTGKAPDGSTIKSNDVVVDPTKPH